MNPALNPDQSNTKPGGIDAIAGEALVRSRLAVLDDDAGATTARHPDAVADLALYVVEPPPTPVRGK